MPTMKQLQAMAKDLNVPGRTGLRKTELIRSIQRAEGHGECFGRIPDCGQTDCLFMPDCLPAQGEGGRT